MHESLKFNKNFGRWASASAVFFFLFCLKIFKEQNFIAVKSNQMENRAEKEQIKQIEIKLHSGIDNLSKM